MNLPLIKWTGSKRSLAKKILEYFPKNINTYYEPFLGGGSVFLELLKNNNYKVNNYYLSDINETLIQLFNIVQNNPIILIDSYNQQWLEFQKDKDFYYIQRDLYNKNKNPLIFYFLTRTCYNGTIRYNSKGEFNTSLHFSRKGITPDKINNIILYYHSLMKNKNILFKCHSFEIIKPNNLDIVYLDPPYTNSKSLYFGNINIDNLFNFINNLNCSWYMNLNAINKINNEIEIPISYDNKLSMSSGKSSYSLLKKKESVEVKDYFYFKNIA